MPHRSSRLIFSSFLFFIFTLSYSHAQSLADASRRGPINDSAVTARTLEGAVYTRDGKPLPGAWVTIRNLQSGDLVFNGKTSVDGAFAVPVAANSTFEVVARQGTDEDRAIARAEDTMSLRMTLPVRAVSRGEPADSISMADLKAPPKAQQALEKGAKALAEKDVTGARKHLEKAVEIYPDYPAALTLLSLTRAKEDPAAALLLARRASQLSPDRAFTRAVLAGLLNDSGQSQPALEEADAAIALSASQWQGHFERARALASLGHLDDALTSTIRADDLTQGHLLSVRIARSRLLAALGRPDEARDQLNAFIQAAPDQASKERAAAEKLTINGFAKK
jgi:tetratricopeptide (TPR) repeat protein